jgi:DNA gyrase subunit A
VADIRVAGRATQGVRIINLREGDSIASVVAVPKEEEDENLVAQGAENAPAVEAEVGAKDAEVVVAQPEAETPSEE